MGPAHYHCQAMLNGEHIVQPGFSAQQIEKRNEGGSRICCRSSSSVQCSQWKGGRSQSSQWRKRASNALCAFQSTQQETIQSVGEESLDLLRISQFIQWSLGGESLGFAIEARTVFNAFSRNNGLGSAALRSFHIRQWEKRSSRSLRKLTVAELTASAEGAQGLAPRSWVTSMASSKLHCFLINAR